MAAPTGEASVSLFPNGEVEVASHIDQSALLAQLPGFTSRKNEANVLGGNVYDNSPIYPMWYLNPGETLQVSALIELNFIDANGKTGSESLPASFYSDFANVLSGGDYAFDRQAGTNFFISNERTILNSFGVRYSGYAVLNKGQSANDTNAGDVLFLDGPNYSNRVDLSLVQPNSNGDYDFSVPMQLSFTNTSSQMMVGRVLFSNWSVSSFGTVPEPATWAFMTLGLGGVVAAASRQRQGVLKAT